jgi:DNA modification methylase/predicted RNA-binding Zn-ribbon protein involved in translation (DUF1610 family)
MANRNENTRLDLGDEQTTDGPVECLGMTFPSDEARREHFLEILREKLQDPDFRSIEGFPIGADEDILALSDPPYYTACPNPFIEDFIEHYGTPYDPETDEYHREPFAADVSEGRHTWIYKAHTYHTKVPPKALVPYIEHYTDPGDIVLDGFCGSGMTGLAGAMATPSRTVLQSDLSPAASFLAYMHSADIDAGRFYDEATRIIDEVDSELGWMYSPPNAEGESEWATYYVWSDVFICPSCGGEMVFAEVAWDEEAGKYIKPFPCPKCGAETKKRDAERAKHTVFDPVMGEPREEYKQVPVRVALSMGNRRNRMLPVTDADLQILDKVRDCPPTAGTSRFRTPMLFREGQWGDQWKNCMHLRCITHAHQLFTYRQLLYIAALIERIDFSIPEHRAILFSLTSVMQKTSRLMVYNADGIGRVQKGTLYISSVWQEMRPTHMLTIAVDDLMRSVKEGMWQYLPSKREAGGTVVATHAGSSTDLPIPDECVDYVFIDPPFGANIPYSEVNFLWECALGVFTNTEPDAIESPIQDKLLSDYQDIMAACLSEFHRVLKPGRWITLEFHNSKNSVWAAVQEALLQAGFVVADVRFLDKKQKSFKQATTTGAVKTDLVISSYKPNGGFVERFELEAGTEEGVWDFIRTHLGQLPVFVTSDDGSEVLAERQDYLLYDRMVALHVQHGATVPLSAAEFYGGLRERFPERDGMFFLPEQVAEYDRKRMQVDEVEQLQTVRH